jgi:hypothetical protein
VENIPLKPITIPLTAITDRLQPGITDRLRSGIGDRLPAGILIGFAPES